MLKTSLLRSFSLIFICFSFFTGFLGCSANEEQNPSIKGYLDLLTQYPDTLGPLGQSNQNEIEIITDSAQMLRIQEKTGRQVGIVARDKYWIWINDVVRFPGGNLGVYGRVLWLKSLEGTPGVAVVPILPDGRIVLNLNYRHATRSWEYELPRGGINPKEDIENAARREVQEETGMDLAELIFLGDLAVDTGFTNSVVPIFAAKVKEQGQARPEDSEAIVAIKAFSYEELKKGYLDGYLLAEINGEKKAVPLRDPFLAFALFQIQLRGYQVHVQE